MRVNFDEIDVLNTDIYGSNIFYRGNEIFTGTIVEYNNEGVIIGELTVVNGTINGRVALYYDNGQIMEEGFQKYNRYYGSFKEWDKNGKLIRQVDFGTEP